MVSLLLLLAGDVQLNPGPAPLRFGLLNINSLRNKAAIVHDLISDYSIDCLALNETRMQADMPSAIRDDAAPPGYVIQHVYRSQTADRPLGGGLALISRNHVIIKPHPLATSLSPVSFELLLVRLTSSKPPLTAAVVYRPPGGSILQFNEELSDVLSELSAFNSDQLLLCGDINCPGVDNCSIDPTVSTTFNDFNLTQHVRSATRFNPDHLLDVFITDERLIVNNVRVEPAGRASDHCLIVADIRAKAVASRPPVTVNFRRVCDIDVADFERRLRQSVLFSAPSTMANDFVEQMKEVVTAILDDVAPLQSVRRRSPKVATRWLSRDAVLAKRERRRLEKRWQRTRLVADRTAYHRSCRRTNNLINQSRANHFRQQISSTTDCRRRWQLSKDLLRSNRPTVDYSYSDSLQLCCNFSNFFIDKIVNLKQAIARTLATLSPTLFVPTDVPHLGPPLDCLPTFDSHTVYKIITSMKPSTSSTDFLPTSLIKSCPLVFSELISRLANLSFAEGVFPDCFKQATVTPLLKKPGLDPSQLTNFRPISNLNTISKILERLFLSVLYPHVCNSPAFNPMQSAYRPFHSTESALLHTLNHIYTSADQHRQPTMLVSLDLSAAFDTIDHSLLISRLNCSFGVRGVALAWLSSYLSNRTQIVQINSTSSNSVNLISGVPQGSVLGPILFTLYVAPICHITNHFGLDHQQYADDTQLFIAVSATNPDISVASLNNCLAAFHYWFCKHGMCLNPSKSEAILFGTNQRLRTFSTIPPVSIAGSELKLANKITTLGVTLDCNLTLDSHVSAVCKSSFFHIRALRHLRSFLPCDIRIAIATALVQSRLDYVNSIYFNCSHYNLHRLQRVQNTLARVVNPNQPISVISQLRSLHWLPIRHRINFKIATLTYKLITVNQPVYLASLIAFHQPARALRSSSQQLLTIPRISTHFGTRAFSYSSPKVWNSIPFEIRQSSSLNVFKTRLKTFYFTLD